MREIADRTFEREFDEGALVVESTRFRNCTFDNCGLSLTKDPSRLARVSGVELVGCYSLNSRIGPCRISDTTVRDLKTGDIMTVWGVLFERVTLSGKIGRVKINDRIHDPHADEARQQQFREMRQAHYAAVDWALDISGLAPQLLDIKGIPAAKVRRNPETQIVVTRARLRDAEQLRAVSGLDTDTDFILRLFLRGDYPGDDVILIAPTGRGPKFYKPVLQSFALLRSAGLAEPD